MAPPATPRGVSLIAFVLAALGLDFVASARRPVRPYSGGCGPTSLYVLSRQLGLNVSPARVFAVCGDNINMTSFDEIARASRRLGLQAHGRMMTRDELRRARPLGMLHVGGNHFVALIGHGAQGVRVADPIDYGQARVEVWSEARLAARWSGRILVVSRPRKAVKTPPSKSP